MKATLMRSMLFMFIMAFTAFTQTAEANDDLDNMLEVRTSDGGTPEEAEAMIDRLENIDDRILYEANRSGAQIILMDAPLTDIPEFAHLSGVTPRGWENSGDTWDDVPGAGGYVTAARIGHSEPGNGNGHSTINLELHEFGHAIDSYVAGFTISESQEFRDVMNEEKDDLFGDHEVSEYFDVPSEYFAEVFGMYYLGGDAKDKLESRAPETYEFISTLHNRLISFSDITGNTMTFTWDDVDEAEAYEIYQNGEKVDEVDSGVEEYTAEDLDVSTNYEFYITALDEDEEPLYDSYYRLASTHPEEDPEEIDTEELEDTLEDAQSLADEFENADLIATIEDAESILDEDSDDVTQAEVNDADDALYSAIENAEENEEDSETSGEDPGSDEPQVSEDTENGDESESAEASSNDNDEASIGSDTQSEEIDEESEDNTTVWVITAVVLIIIAIVISVILILRRK